MALTCCDFQKAQTSELLKVLIPRSRFAQHNDRGQARPALHTACAALRSLRSTIAEAPTALAELMHATLLAQSTVLLLQRITL